MSPPLWLFVPVFFSIVHAVPWPNTNNTVVPLRMAPDGKHWTVDVQVKTSSSGTVIVPLIVDSSIGHAVIMSHSLCDLRICDGCGYTPPATGTCLPVNPTPAASGEESLLVDGTTVSLFVASASAPAAFLNSSFPVSPSSFALAVPGDNGGDRYKLQRSAAFWNGTGGR